ncbi:MAG: alpha/beta hydrolase-fold protein [Akkermansiaceae bacterium]|jgi:pimeloyl-ACP methyl ester carboxylesterase|nr:alpha/beta hydrolase-fold protein [Akkermansiaceae bacterium]MDP4647625.1 alpha/beta hydrolase-fold protein [Akkermansiaceae bacterium]MDP4722316.1 alpha/beta hydrolase-fold protein [Akkermansiaceae bacterium]MDP4780356.1 alpha/beta hydrolase-fold protein [Akkermansiaceae bacterium]MDP4846161.1 alpha/beta hydrolase-fold protein [Akkermansiaceae bacterium]
MKRLLFLLLGILPSCAYLPRPAHVPVKTLSAGNPAGKELVVFLPGRWSLVGEFKKEGLFQIAEEKWPEARLVAPDLHLGYYQSQAASQRLHEDIILPAKASGVETIRLVGVSMGGLGALIYDLEHPGEIDEIYLLAPFLGEEEAIAEIEAAGSLRKWKPGTIEEKDFSRRLWVGLREKWLEKGDRPTLYLGCGTEDRLAPSSRLLAQEFLSEGDTTWLPGGHDWPVWRKLFAEMTAKY